MSRNVHVVFEPCDDEVMAYCDELNAVASGATKSEALANLQKAIAALVEEYGDEVTIRSRDRSEGVLELA